MTPFRVQAEHCSLQELITNSKQIYLLFIASWCPCSLAGVTQIENSSDDQVSCGIVDVDLHDTLSAYCNVFKVPTLIRYEHGKEIDRVVGEQVKTTLSQIVNQITEDE